MMTHEFLLFAIEFHLDGGTSVRLGHNVERPSKKKKVVSWQFDPIKRREKTYQ